MLESCPTNVSPEEILIAAPGLSGTLWGQKWTVMRVPQALHLSIALGASEHIYVRPCDVSVSSQDGHFPKPQHEGQL